MTAARIDPDELLPSNPDGKAAGPPQFYDTVIAAINEHADGLDTASAMYINAKNHGASGDGSTNDHAALQAAANFAASTLSSGQYGAMIYLPKGRYVVDAPILLPEGVGIVGDNPAACKIVASPSFNDTAVIKNSPTGQEFCFLQGITVDGNRAGGAVQSVAVVDLTSCFINSFVRDCIISGGSSVGLHIGATVAAGPVLVENTWVLDHAGDCIVVDEDPANAQSVQGILLVNVAAERQGGGCAAIRLHGRGNSSGWHLVNTHIEMTNNSAGTIGIIVDNVAYVIIDGAQIQATNGVGSIVGIQITNTAQNLGIQCRNITNINGISPIIQDLKSGCTLGQLNVPHYATADTGIFPQGVNALTYGVTVTPDLTKGDYCELLVTDGNAFAIANPTNARLGQEITIAIFNFSGGAMGALSWGSEFSFRDASFSAPANGKGRTLRFRRRTSNSWIQVGAASGDM